MCFSQESEARTCLHGRRLQYLLDNPTPVTHAGNPTLFAVECLCCLGWHGLVRRRLPALWRYHWSFASRHIDEMLANGFYESAVMMLISAKQELTRSQYEMGLKLIELVRLANPKYRSENPGAIIYDVRSRFGDTPILDTLETRIHATLSDSIISFESQEGWQVNHDLCVEFVSLTATPKLAVARRQVRNEICLRHPASYTIWEYSRVTPNPLVYVSSILRRANSLFSSERSVAAFAEQFLSEKAISG